MTTKDWLDTANTEATLKEVRLKIEEALALTLHDTLHHRAIIEQQAECIAEGDDVIDRLKLEITKLSHQNKRLSQIVDERITDQQDEIEQLRDQNERLIHQLAQPNLARKMKQHQLDRMENVTRKAAAALRHMEDGNYEVAKQFLIPLAQGVHDVYKDAGDFAEVFRAARPEDANKDDDGAGQLPMFNRWDETPHDIDAAEEMFAKWFANTLMDRAIEEVKKEKDDE